MSPVFARLDELVRSSLEMARSNAAGLARAAHEIVDVGQAEATPTVEGTLGRARLLDNEGVRAALVVVSVLQQAGRLNAYGEVLATIERMAAEERAAAVARVEQEAQRDAATFRQAVADGESGDDPPGWASEAFDAWVVDEPGAFAPLDEDEARAIHGAAFMRALPE